MDAGARIRTAFERTEKVLTRRPGVGRGTATTRVRLVDGLTCEIEDGPWKLVADMAEKSGGNNAGPNPGVLGRGALGACLAMSYATWAAKRGVPVSGIEVEIQADYDTRGHYGVADVPAGYTEVRYVVTVQSDVPEADILRLLDEAEAHTSYVDVFRRPQRLCRDVRVVAPRSS